MKTMTCVLLIAAVVLAAGCDGHFQRTYTIQSETPGLWAVPVIDGKIDRRQNNAPVLIPQWNYRARLREEDELDQYRVTIEGELNESPTHPIAVFADGREWARVCANPGAENRARAASSTDDAGCVGAVEEDVDEGWGWYGETTGRARVELAEDALEGRTSPAVFCEPRAAANSSVGCEVGVRTEHTLDRCMGRLIRIYDPILTSTQAVAVEIAEADQAVSDQVLRFDVDVINDLAGRPLPLLPAVTYVLFDCANDADEVVRFVAAPVVQEHNDGS